MTISPSDTFTFLGFISSPTFKGPMKYNFVGAYIIKTGMLHFYMEQMEMEISLAQKGSLFAMIVKSLNSLMIWLHSTEGNDSNLTYTSKHIQGETCYMCLGNQKIILIIIAI